MMSNDAHKLYQYLKQVANAEKLTTYGKVADLLGLDLENPDDHFHKLPAIMQEVNEHMKERGYPMISALVILKKEIGIKPSPGDGFYQLMIKWKLMTRKEDRFNFWSREVTKIHGRKW